MSAAQMAFLEAQRKKKLAESKPSNAGGSAPAQDKNNTVSSTTAPSAAKVNAPDENNISTQPQKKTLQDMWRFTEGGGTLGTYTVCRHSPSGLVLELWQEGSGSFAFRRATRAKVKYCSSYGSLQEEPILAAAGCESELENGGGAPFKAGNMSAGCWGEGETRGKRFVFSCVVKTREGPEKIELVLTRTGFIFIPAEGFKAVAVRNGEFMQVTKEEARNLIKGADVDDEPLGGKN